MNGEVYELRPPAFDGGFWWLNIGGETWLLLSDVCREIGMHRWHAKSLCGEGVMTVHVTRPGFREPAEHDVISDQGAMDLVGAREHCTCQTCRASRRTSCPDD